MYKCRLRFIGLDDYRMMGYAGGGCWNEIQVIIAGRD